MTKKSTVSLPIFHYAEIIEPIFSTRLNGWFLGPYGAYGKYDLCYNDKGVDGSNLYSMGLSTGYAHRISSHLGLEYSLALGYLYTEYYDYDKVHGTKYGDIKAVSYPWQVEHSSWIIQKNISSTETSSSMPVLRAGLTPTTSISNSKHSLNKYLPCAFVYTASINLTT